MRRFELVGGRSEKFWEVDRDGGTVTVRFGRLGTGGQRQVKELGSEGAAVAQVDKLVAEKVRKGYREVGSPVSSDAVASDAVTSDRATPAVLDNGEGSAQSRPVDGVELPDEDTFAFPSAWRQFLHPRRGGVPGPALEADRDRVWRLVDEVRGSADDLLEAIGGEIRPIEEAVAYLRSDGAQATPLGAAVAAAVVRKCLAEGEAWHRFHELPAFVDTWVADQGLAFAVRAAVEFDRVRIESVGDVRRPTAHLVVRAPRAKIDQETTAGPLAVRLRAHLAVADEVDHQAAVAALGELRFAAHERLLAAYLVPGRADWVADACAATALNPPMLWCAVGSVDVASSRASDRDARLIQQQEAFFTLVEAVGPALAPVIARWSDSSSIDTGDVRRLLGLLAVLPTDEAFDLLVRRLGRKHVQPVLLEAIERFPVRATRLLARAADTSAKIAPIAAELLRAHLTGKRALIAAVRRDLPADVRAVLDRIELGAPQVAEADPGALPALLAEPPWTRARVAAKPIVVEGLDAGTSVTVVWNPGEQQEWAATRGWVSVMFARDGWAESVRQFHTGYLMPELEASLLGAGPAELVRPLLATWQPRYLHVIDDWLRSIVARYELDALPLALRVAGMHPPTGAAVLLPFADAGIAALMAAWLRLKSVRRTALAWFARHAPTAARHLIPPALGKPGKERNAAEAALRLLPPDVVMTAARAHGDDAEAAVRVLLAADPLDRLPARIPEVPGWADPGLFPSLVLRDGGGALPVTAVGHVITMLAMSEPGEVYAGVEAVKQACDPVSLAGFGWALFERWRAAGMPAKQSWALDALGWFGDDETVRKLTPLIRAWPGEGGHARAVNGLDVLAAIGTDTALMNLYGISEKVKFKALKTRAQEKVAEVAENLGLSADQLGDRLVPDLGLDANGTLTLDYGPRRFVVGFDEQLRPFVADEDGKRRKDLPKPGLADDQDLASAARARFTALKKDVRTIAADQVRRLEQAMVAQRRWTAGEFADLFVVHPLLWHIVRRLVWATFAEDGTEVLATFRVAEDRSLADADDEVFTLPESASVGIAHPLHLAGALPVWARLFADYEILQPFPQLGRAVHTLTADERAATSLSRFEKATVATAKVLDLVRRGWQRAAPQEAGSQPWITRRLPGNRVAVVNLHPGLTIDAIDLFPEHRVEHVWLGGIGDGEWRPSGGCQFGELDPVSASEVLTDLTELTS